MGKRGPQLRTHCYMGHPLEGDNLRAHIYKRDGREFLSRSCYECKKRCHVLRYHKKKAAAGEPHVYYTKTKRTERHHSEVRCD